MASAGGVQSYMWRLWEMLQLISDQDGTQINGLSLRDSSEALKSYPNITKSRPTGAAGSKAAFVFKALSGAGRSDVVIVGHINQSPVAWVAKTLGLIKDYVVVLHGIEAWQRTGWLRRRSMKSAGSIVATTRYTALECSEVHNIPEGLFKVIPLCAEPIPDEPDPDFRLDGEWPILFVARLAKTERYKGLETVMEAVAELRNEGSPIKLHVIGDGDDRSRLESQARELMLGDQGIRFHGRVDGATLQAAYKSAKAFVMPSAKEGFGIVFLEAMRYAVPCIGGAHGGTPEVFEAITEGLLVEYRRTKQLKSAIEKLLSPAIADKVGTSARARFQNDYTFEIFSDRWIHYLLDTARSQN